MEATHSGIDLAGIAAIITAASGLIATIGALIIGLRKRSSDSTERVLTMLLEMQTSRMDPPKDSNGKKKKP